jgi:hypothetical protein
VTAPTTTTGEITLTMTPAVAEQVHSVLVEGYRAMRYDSQATQEWCREMLVTIDGLAAQLKAGALCLTN